MMTRGLKDSYGRKVASPWVLIPMCLLFVGGLLDWRRLRSLRTLDVIMLISFVVSLEFFNRGRDILLDAAVLPADDLPRRAHDRDRLRPPPAHGSRSARVTCWC